MNYWMLPQFHKHAFHIHANRQDDILHTSSQPDISPCRKEDKVVFSSFVITLGHSLREQVSQSELIWYPTILHHYVN